MLKLIRILTLTIMVFPATLVAGDNIIEEPVKKDSPWLLTPTLSSDPKMGSSLGAMVGYLKKFDEKSPTSMFGAMGSYSDTDSTMYGLFARTYFGADSHRIMAGLIRGKIENDYEDFLGAGIDARTTDDIGISFIRYLKRVHTDWFVGAQLIAMDYEISARDQFTQDLLESIGLTGFYSNGLGVVVERDSRDSQNSPQSGSHFTFNNTAFREVLGGDESFDSYAANYSSFWGHGSGHVVASRITGRWTQDAPVSGYSSVELRGYTRGEYLAPHSSTIEVEERYALNEKWGATAFLGAACLYGNDASCADQDSWFPAAGAGLTYMIKAQERMVVRAEIAIGKSDNNGFYIQFGNAF